MRIWILPALAAALFAQTPDASGNAMLRGRFQFREVAILDYDANGNPAETAAASGSIVFDGAGRYTVSGTYQDTNISSGTPQTLALYGDYTIASSGAGTLTNPLDPSTPASAIYGAVGQGIFAGSSTEGNVNNLFIAIPAGNAANFDTPYSMGVLDFTAGRNALMQLAPDGHGGLGSGGTYSVAADGSISLHLPQSAAKTMFTSVDGNFTLGWTPGGYDLLFGVKASPGDFHGLYYLAALRDHPGSANSCGAVDSFYGSLIADGSGNQIVHERLASPFCYVVDFETDDHMALNGTQYALGAGGAAFVGIGAGGALSLTVGMRANDFSGSGTFLSPIGIANAASFAPITMSLAPGELITLYGGGLSSETKTMQGGQSFPAQLGGVEVRIGGAPAPIFYVSPEQIAAIVPYGIRSSASGLVTIQVNNNGVRSNTLTLFSAATAPGIFTQSANGLGSAAAVHAATGNLVTASNPARSGEFVSIYLTGLGSVSPIAPDGAPGAAAPLNNADVFLGNHLSVYFDDYAKSVFAKANITYAGLAPGLAGLYQINVQVPDGIGPGDVYLEIVTDTADVNQATIPVWGR